MSSKNAVIMAGLAMVVFATDGSAIPYFARRYDVTCQRCHSAPPKLNEFGEAFRARGYRMPAGFDARRTIPLAVWLSGRSDALHDEPDVAESVRAYVNKLEIISGGSVIDPRIAYFVEWRPVSLETTRRQGRIELRDRSGRFEDIFVTLMPADRLEVAAGQYRALNQVDVSLRLGLSEPLVLAAGLPGRATGLERDSLGNVTRAASRQLSLRAFAPSGRAPSLRVGWATPLRADWTWRSSATVPLPGEFSVPLTKEARFEASNELEFAAKGVFLESYVRKGLATAGAHAFYDHRRRFMVQAVTTGSRGPLHWTAIAGMARAGDPIHARWSLEAAYLPDYHFGAGARVEDRAGDGAPVGVIPYLNVHFPGMRWTLRLTIESRIQRGNDATLIELATIF